MTLRPLVLALLVASWVVACDGRSPPGDVGDDAGASDAAQTDAGPDRDGSDAEDAGPTDGSVAEDAGQTDGGPADADPTDVGPADDGGGPDGGAADDGGTGTPVCGNGEVESGEECDDANPTVGDGCEPGCTFTCVSTDPTRDCTPADPCQGQGSCNDATHTCTPGTPLGDNASCGAGAYCQGGVCTTAGCGNGFVEPGEDCEDGNPTSGDGCEPDCHYTCGEPATDCAGAPPACQVWTCSAAHLCVAVADASQDGTSCGSGLVCKSGACVTPAAVCGNGIIEQGEQCDFGAGNGPNTGCETTCLFSCAAAADCIDPEPCNGTEACIGVTVDGQAGQQCQPGASLTDGTACGAGRICLAGACQASECGDGFIDAGRGETCEPPATATCDATCHLAPVCGNGVREAGEQCDDGNTTNLDACSAACRFEQSHRINWLNMRFTTDTGCAENAFGTAIGALAQSSLQSSLTAGVADGSISVLFAMLGLTDLSGTSESPVTVGVVNGEPVLPAGSPAYNGAADLDFWYRADPSALDAARLPTEQLTGAIAAKVLTAGPGPLTFNVILAGAPSPLRMSNARIVVTLGATSTPLAAAGGLPPGHLASEQLDPALASYATAGQPTANGGGNLCGNISAWAFSRVLLPADITSVCTAYTASNSLLDLLVGGCTAYGLITVIRATQPDQIDPDMPAAGAGGPYRLSAGANRVVNACRDQSNTVVDLDTCLNAAAYSSYFKFTTDRVIIVP